jgi:hypothetical protein
MQASAGRERIAHGSQFAPAEARLSQGARADSQTQGHVRGPALRNDSNIDFTRLSTLCWARWTSAWKEWEQRRAAPMAAPRGAAPRGAWSLLAVLLVAAVGPGRAAVHLRTGTLEAQDARWASAGWAGLSAG